MTRSPFDPTAISYDDFVTIEFSTPLPDWTEADWNAGWRAFLAEGHSDDDWVDAGYQARCWWARRAAKERKERE